MTEIVVEIFDQQASFVSSPRICRKAAYRAQRYHNANLDACSALQTDHGTSFQ